MELPLEPVKKVLKKSNMRISDEAVEEFALFLEEIASDVAAEAVAMAKSEGRKTVNLRDVKAIKRKLV